MPPSKFHIRQKRRGDPDLLREFSNRKIVLFPQLSNAFPKGFHSVITCKLTANEGPGQLDLLATLAGIPNPDGPFAVQIRSSLEPRSALSVAEHEVQVIRRVAVVATAARDSIFCDLVVVVDEVAFHF